MQFHYKGLKKGKIISGKIEANNQKDAISSLKKNSLFPIEVKEIKSSGSSISNSLFGRVGFTDIVDLTRQLSIMLNAGLTLVDSFDILKKQVTKPQLLIIIETLDKEIKGGRNFSEALQLYPQYFSNLYIALIKSGEASGKLSEILLKLAENLEKQRAFKGKIKGALIYPVIVIIGMVSVMFIMITFVIPRLLNLYKDFDIELPWSTQFLITVSSFTTAFWPLIIGGVFGGSILLKRYLKTKAGKHLFDSMMLKIPIINNVVRMAVLVDSTRTLSILIGAGVSILDGLSIIIETTENSIYQDSFKVIYKEVEKGISLGQAMTNEGVFPPILVQMTTVGEQTGHLDDTLGRISVYFEMESELAVKAMTTMIEPAILVVLGLGVGFLVMSVITPIYNLTTSF